MLTLLNNATVYAPAHLGMRNLLIGGGQILAISESPLAASGAHVIDLAAAKNSMNSNTWPFFRICV